MTIPPVLFELARQFMLLSLLSIGGAHPWWSIGIFALCLWVLHGLVVFGDDDTVRA